MFLSIIVPVYNVEEYIDECLRSLVNQDVRSDEYEIICVNDGSTDNSAKIIKDYVTRYNNISMINQENMGLSGARNSGLAVAKGEYVWFVDSDDLVVHNVLSCVINKLKALNSDVLITKPISFTHGDSTDAFTKGIVEPDETSNTYDSWLWTRFIKRSIIVSSGVRFCVGIMGEDTMFCSMLAPYVTKIDRYDKVTYGYRIRPNSLTTKRVKDKIDLLINTSKAFLECRKEGILKDDSAVISMCEHLTPIMAYASRLPHKEMKIIIDKLKKQGLYPIKRQKAYDEFCVLKYKENSVNEKNFDDRIFFKLKSISYTRYGYHLLRIWRVKMKVTSKLFPKK